MRNLLLALTLTVAGTTAAPAQSDDWAKKIFLANKGSTSHEFGTVAYGSQLYHRFPLTNIYAVKLEITNIRVACGCVTATASKQVFEPRENGYIEVSMDARRFKGPKTVSIYITVGPEYISTGTLQVTANSRTDVVFNPGQITFGVVSRGETPTKEIDVEYAGNFDWRVTEILVHKLPVTATVKELYRKPGQVGYRVKATLKPDAPAGLLKQEIRLKTNDPASPEVPVLLEANIQAPLTVSPGTLNLGTAKLGGDPVTKKIVVKGIKPFKILAIEGKGDDIVTEAPSTAAAVHIVTIKYQPTKEGELRKELHIETDLEKDLSVKVNLEGNAVP